MAVNTTARHIFHELQEKGYRGGETMVRDCVTRLRKTQPSMKRPPRGAKGPMPPPSSRYSPRELRWLLAKPVLDLKEAEVDILTCIADALRELILEQQLTSVR